MKVYSFIAVCFCLMVSSTLYGQDRPAVSEKLTVAPNALTLSCERFEKQKRTLLLHSGTEIKDLKIVTADLTKDGGSSVLAAEAVQTIIARKDMPAGDYLSIPVTFDLKDAQSGRFQGEIRIVHADGTEIIPVTLQVRDQMGFPLLVLAFGVLMGMGVSLYRSRGKPRDEILVRIGRIKAHMNKDPDLNHGLVRDRLIFHLENADAELQSHDFQEAGVSADKADKLMTEWRNNKNVWKARLKKLENLKQLVGKMEDASACKRAVQNLLEETEGNATEDGLEKMQETLGTVAVRINRYRRASALIQEINTIRNSLPAEQGEPLRVRVLEYTERLNGMTFENENDSVLLMEDLKKDLENLGSGIQPRTVFSYGVSAESSPDTEEKDEDDETQKEEKRNIFVEKVLDARFRLQAFTYTTFGFAVVLMAGAGFGELYYGNPVFGAEPWGDYFSLLAWGFGAEASRASITDLVKGWGVSTEQK